MLADPDNGRTTDLDELTKKQLIRLILQESLVRGKSPVLSPRPAPTPPSQGQECARCADLELQNHIICEAQNDLEASRTECFDLFEDAPIAYCRLDARGIVTSANVLARRMARPQIQIGMVGRPLVQFMTLPDRLTFEDLLRKVSLDTAAQIFECDRFGRGAELLRVDLIVSRESAAEANFSIGYKVVIVDMTKRRAMEAGMQLLVETSRLLGNSLDFMQNIPAVLAKVTSPRTPLCFVDLKGIDGPCTRLFARQDKIADAPELALIDSVYALGSGSTAQAQVMGDGKGMVSPYFAGGLAGTDAGQHHPAASAVLPLVAHHQVLGCLTLVRGAGQKPYNAADLQTAFALAERIAMAVFTGQTHRNAQQAVRERQVVLGTVSHDLKNVITAVILRSDFLAEADDVRASKAGRAISRLAGRMNRMLEDLMDVASIDRGQLSLRPVEKKAQWVLEEAAESSRAMAQAQNITLSVESGPERIIFCDVDRCLQVLTNLLSNAVKFSEPGSKITLRQRSGGAQHVVFSVEDQGPGLSPEACLLVFDNFWRAPSQRAEGRGLGLTICRGIVEGSGGKIWVESTPGRGSTFLFTMPAVQDSAKSTDLLAEKKILVVDDDEDLRFATCAILEQAGYAILEACNGQQALNIVRGNCHPSLVLLDLNMPVFNGWQFLEERAQCKALQSLNILVVSGEKVAESGVLQHGVGFLLKPVNGKDLLSSVRERMEKLPETCAVASFEQPTGRSQRPTLTHT